MKKIQYGCGLCAPEDWVNFDSSPTIFLQRIPLIGKIFQAGSFPDFPKNIRRGSISKGLPMEDGSADLAYCSHVLEHLALEEFRFALRETFRILKPGGVFRLVMPDLETYIREYHESNEDDRALKFMERTLLGVKKRPKGFAGFARHWLGGSEHLWLWDFTSVQQELVDAGFQEVRRAVHGDAQISDFDAVEDVGRWDNTLGVHCQKG